MPFSITIAGVDRTNDVLHGTISIEDVINDQQNTCTFKLVNRSGNGIPNPDQEIIMTLASGTRIFGGYIVAVSVTKGDSGIAVATIKCVDYVRLLDRNLAHISYESQTDEQIIDDLVAQYCLGLGITTTNVISGATIDQISFNYIQLSQVMRKICDLTGRSWYIDYYKDIHYFPTTQNIAPFSISSQTMTGVDENMNAAPTGTLLSSAAYISASKYLRFTIGTAGAYGAIEYTQATSPYFTMQATIDTINAGGGQSYWFYWGCSSSPSSDAGGYGGYQVVLNYDSNQLKLYFNSTLLTTISSVPAVDDQADHVIKIVQSNTNIKVYIDGTVYLNYDDTARSLPGSKTGVGAINGASLTNGQTLKSLQIYDEAIDYRNLQIIKDNSQLKNRVYVRGGTKLSDFTTYVEVGDGQKRKFVLPDKPHDVTIEVDTGSGYVTKTLGIKNINTSGYDWYLNFQEKYLEQDSGGTVLSTAHKIRVTYKYDIPILVAQEDTTSIAANGQHEFAIFDKSINTTQAARDRAVAELTDYAASVIEGSFSTYTEGFKAGQYMRINHSDYGVNADYIVQRVTATAIGGGLFQYFIEIASAKTMGIIRFLIELLEANKNLIELDDNEVIDELFTLSDSLLSDSLTDALTIDSWGAYNTWCTDSLQATPNTRARWDLFQWG